MDWVISGWKPLFEALGEQHVDIQNIVAEDNSVMMQYHYSTFHRGTLAGKPQTNVWNGTRLLSLNSPMAGKSMICGICAKK
jgi:hypothetical protein